MHALKTGSVGLAAALQKFLNVIQDLNDITSDVNKIADPTTAIDARIAAYNELAQIVKVLQGMSESAKTSPFLSIVLIHVQTLLTAIPVSLPSINKDGGPTTPLMFQGRQATLWDVVSAINSGDTAHDFYIDQTLSKGNIQPVAWFTDSDTLSHSFNTCGDMPVHCGQNNTDPKTGVNWKVEEHDSGCKVDHYSIHAELSVQSLEKYAVGSTADAAAMKAWTDFTSQYIAK